MIAALSLLLLSASAPVAPTGAAPVLLLPPSGAPDGTVDEKIAEAGDDVDKLLALAESYADSPMRNEADKIFVRVLELDPDNEVAHKGLRHQLYDGQWFESYVELAKYKREEAARMKEKGLARWKDEWVPEGDVAFLNMGWEKDASGSWINPMERARAEQVAAWKAEGCQFRADDNSWVAPDDFEKWTALQWKCGDEWLDTEAANAYHATLPNAWELAGEHFLVRTTCDWETGNLARWYADRTWADLVRLFGAAPESPPWVVVLNGLGQYNQIAGSQSNLVETEGISSLHGAYFADGAYDLSAQPPQFEGVGVCYWDRSDPQAAGWGPFWVRWAAGQSFVEGLDPSWNAVGQWIASEGRADLAAYGQSFWREKRIPRWMRYGAASYVERYMKNPEAAEGADPWDLRAFAFGQVAGKGGLRPLEEVFAFRLDINVAEGSSRLYHEAGLVVAFLLDGAPGDAELRKALEGFQSALGAGSKDEVDAAARALEAKLVERDAAIRAFAGL